MQNSLTPTQQLDKILKHIAKRYGDEKEGTFIAKKFENIVLVASKFDPPIDRDGVYSIVTKLVKDGYAHVETMDHGTAGTIFEYSPTFEGLTLLQSGGYEKAEERKATQASLQSSQTMAIVIGTVLAGLYGLFEICKEIYQMCSH